MRKLSNVGTELNKVIQKVLDIVLLSRVAPAFAKVGARILCGADNLFVNYKFHWYVFVCS
jgi:hypothetical protein